MLLANFKAYTVLVALLIMNVHSIHADTLSDVNANISKLQTYVQQEQDLRSKLADTHDQLKTQLLDSIDDILKNTLAAQQKNIQAAQDSIKSIPQEVLSIVQIGTLPTALNQILQVIQAAAILLEQVRAQFNTIILYLDQTSAQGKPLYHNIDNSITGLQSAVSQLQTIAKLLGGLGNLSS